MVGDKTLVVSFRGVGLRSICGRVGRSRIPLDVSFGEKPKTSAIVLLESSTGRWLCNSLAKSEYDPHIFALESFSVEILCCFDGTWFLVGSELLSIFETSCRGNR